MNKPPPPPSRARPRTSQSVTHPTPGNEPARLEFDDFVPLDDISITPVDSLVPVRMLDLADDLTDDAEDAAPDVDATRRRRDRQMVGIGALTAALVFGTTAWWLGGRAARSASAEAQPATHVVELRPAAPVATAAVPPVATTASVAPAPATVVPTAPTTTASATTMASPVDSASPVIAAPRRPKRKHPDHVPPTASFPD